MASAQSLNTLTKAEAKKGFTLLFDGKTTNGWHLYGRYGAQSTWSVANGILKLDPKVRPQADLVTDKEYENFELTLDWNIAEGGNSGIIVDVHEDPSFKATYDTGWEMQVLDNIKAEDNKLDNHLAGSLYDLLASPKNVAKPAGQWNSVRLVKNNGHVTAWLNGKQTFHVMLWDDGWKKMIDASKFKGWKGFAAYKKGHIALQQHGAVVSYRNIKIKEL